MNEQNPNKTKHYFIIFIVSFIFGVITHIFITQSYARVEPVSNFNEYNKPIKDTKTAEITSGGAVGGEQHISGGDKPTKETNQGGTKPVLGGADKLMTYGIQEDVAKAMMGPQYKYIDPKYYAVIGLSENARNPRAVGDSGCSNGPYQFNKCSGDGERAKQIWFGMNFEECSKDFVCATKMLHDKIIGAYKCDVQEDGSISNREECLPKHQGFIYDGWYKEKIIKYHTLLFGE